MVGEVLSLTCFIVDVYSYAPGAWIEKAGGMKLSDYNVPETTSLILVGPKGSGKSSLINKISRVFEDHKYASERAQVSCMVISILHVVDMLPKAASPNFLCSFA